MSKPDETVNERLAKVQMFHRRVELGAGIAFKVMLEGLAEDHDLQFVEPSAIEVAAKAAWAWGVTFAESAGAAD